MTGNTPLKNNAQKEMYIAIGWIPLVIDIKKAFSKYDICKLQYNWMCVANSRNIQFLRYLRQYGKWKKQKTVLKIPFISHLFKK